MKTSQLFVNGVELDLLPGTVISMTIQNYNPMVPDTVKYSYSNRIQVPITTTNRVALNCVDNLNAVSAIYKTRLPARFVQNGIEIIPNGYVLLLGIKDNFFEMAIYDGYLDLFSKLADRQLIDLDYRDVNGAYLGAADFFHLSGAGTFYAGKVNLAAAELGGNVTSFAAPNVKIASAFTFFGYQNMIEKIISQAGYTFDYGSFGLYDPTHSTGDFKYRFMAVAQGNKKYLTAYSDRFRKRVEFVAQNTADQTFAVGLAASKVLFDSTVVDSTFWDLANDKYIVTNADTASTFFITNFQFNCTLTLTAPGGSTARVMIYVNGAMSGSTTVGVGTTNTSVTLTQALKNGDYVEIWTDCNNAINNITVKAGCSFFNNTSLGGGAAYMYFNEFLPEGVTQLELLKDMLFRFGQIPKQSNNKVYFKYLGDIVNDQANVTDWTGKRDLVRYDEVIFSLTELAQLNTFRYSIQEALNERYGDGSYSLDDLSLAAEKITTSKVIASEDVFYNGLNWVKIPIMDTISPTTFAGNPGFRLVNLRTSYSYDPPLKYDVAAPIAGGGYFVANFQKSETGGTGLPWSTFFAEQYVRGGSNVLTRLKNAKWVTRYYNLNDIDIATLDPHKMIFDSGSYFLFPKIFNFLPGVVSKVQMLKI